MPYVLLYLGIEAARNGPEITFGSCVRSTANVKAIKLSFFLHFLQNLANCAENVTTPTHRQSKQNVCLKNRSHGGFIAYSRLLLYCIVRILHQSVFVGKNTMCWVSS